MRKDSCKGVLNNAIWVFEHGPCPQTLAFSCTCTGDVVLIQREEEKVLGLAIFLGLPLG